MSNASWVAHDYGKPDMPTDTLGKIWTPTVVEIYVEEKKVKKKVEKKITKKPESKLDSKGNYKGTNVKPTKLQLERLKKRGLA